MSGLFKVGPIACLLVALAGGCTTIGDRLARAQTALDVAQATADFYVKDGGDESCSVAVVSPESAEFASAGSALNRVTSSLARACISMFSASSSHI